MGQLLDNRLVAVDLLAHGLNRLAKRVDLLVECLDTLHQLRRHSAQLFRRQVIEIGEQSDGPILPEQAVCGDRPIG